MTRNTTAAKPEQSRAVSHELPEDIAVEPALERLLEVEVPEPLREPISAAELTHRDFDESEFWRAIPAYRELSRDEFMDHRFQSRQSITSLEQLEATVGGLASQAFLEDVRDGQRRAPMALRISPYIISRIDWSEPFTDPLRVQFLPVSSTAVPDHPRLSLDSLHEQLDSPTPGLVHRYRDKALFLALDVCPIYCRFCTRSYAIGGDTSSVDKVSIKPNPRRWDKAFAYLASRPEIEDVVISGGDAYVLPPTHIKSIGETLLAIPHIRRIRFASKGPAIMPMKILSDGDWTDALTSVFETGRKLHKEVCLHTHFNSATEITEITREAMNELFSRGIPVRNQSVLIRGVNDDSDRMLDLIQKLSYMNVQPYYVYQHDMVKRVEELRTRVEHSTEIERSVRGATAGFNTPLFVVDLPGGGGKRDLHSYDHYDRTNGISVYRSSVVEGEKVYLYFDPLHLLPVEGRRRWHTAGEDEVMIREAIAAAGLEDLTPAVPTEQGQRPTRVR